MSISLKTRKMLWGGAGSRCAFPDCRKTLFEDKTETDDISIIGEEAHIVAKDPKEARGESYLTQEQRDNFDNLILLCSPHHKIIDDQPNKYTVKVLSRMKQDHIDWVDQNLNFDINKQKDEEIYATYIDEWVKMADINNWCGWSSYILGDGQPQIMVEQIENLKKLDVYILSRVWPKLYPKVEFAFNNFRVILNDFFYVFFKYIEQTGNQAEPWYITEKFYKRLDRYDPEEYKRLSEKFNYHVDLVQDLMLELTRAGNYLCDQIRKYISSSFRINEGILLAISGPHMDLNYKTSRPEYESIDESYCKYPGLRKFMEVRRERDLHFGEGISEDYFHLTL